MEINAENARFELNMNTWIISNYQTIKSGFPVATEA
jgi:hypothetical protein